MKKKPTLKEVEITASYTGKIATGNFENESPFFSITERWSGAVNVDKRQEELSKKCYDKFLLCEQRSLIDKLQKARKDLRFYPSANESYPSITSIIGWDKDFFVSEEDLVQYAARGTIFHKQAEIWFKENRWVEPKDLVECHKEFVVVKRGSLNLNLDGYSMEGLCKKYKIEPIDIETVAYNHEFKYAGRRDLKAKVDGVITICDWKTSNQLDKEYVLQQLAAHAHCPDNKDVKQVMAVAFNDNTVQKFSKPLIVPVADLEPYWQLFLKNRENFKYRFGV